MRTQLKGKQVRFTYPHAARIQNLEDARKWAHAMLDKCQADIDPREEQRAARRKIDASQQLQFKRKLLRLGFVAPRHIAGRPGFNEGAHDRGAKCAGPSGYDDVAIRIIHSPLLFALPACQKANASLLNALGAYPV